MKSSKRLKIALFIFITVTVVFIGLILMLLPKESKATDAATTGNTTTFTDTTATYVSSEDEEIIPDFDTALSEAVSILEENLWDVEDAKNMLPEYVSLAEYCKGDLIDSTADDIVVLLEFSEAFLSELSEMSDANVRWVICVFCDNLDKTYTCTNINKNLIANILAKGKADCCYTDMDIENKVLSITTATYNDASDINHQRVYSFKENHEGLMLKSITDFTPDENGSAGILTESDFFTGVFTAYNTFPEDRKEKTGIKAVGQFVKSVTFDNTLGDEHCNLEFLLTEEENINLLASLFENVELDSDTELEEYEWVDEEKTCFRVRIQWKEKPMDNYRHKEDYFFFLDDEGSVLNVHFVNYAAIVIGYACGFDAHLEDVTFDGHPDLIIWTGDANGSVVSFNAAYIYQEGEYVYEETFNDIPLYQVDADNQVITGRLPKSDKEIFLTYKYIDGKFVEIDRVEKEY